jgi:hypothetical protein
MLRCLLCILPLQLYAEERNKRVLLELNVPLQGQM